MLDNDTDDDDDPLTAEIVDGPTYANGFQLYSDGQFYYAPTGGYVGGDSFTYKAWDGANYSNTVTVSLTVTNTAPVAVADGVYSTQQGVAIHADNDELMGVLDNDDDNNGDSLTAELVDGPSHANDFQLYSDGQFYYAPTGGYAGNDSFTYNAWDGAEYSNTVTVTINVTNILPVALDDSYTTDEDTPVSVPVLNNDSDDGGDSLVIFSWSVPAHGTFDPDTLTYTPDFDYHGSDSFTYYVSDGNGGVDSATVSVTINSVNDAPEIFAPWPMFTTKNTPLT